MRLVIYSIIIIFCTEKTVFGSGGLSVLKEFMNFNDVPTEIPLGLLSNTNKTVPTSLVNGTCFQYDVHDFVRCKYYSDCCAMTPSRPVEQLAYNTFSCHDGFYIVDRCPKVIVNEEIRDLCEDFSSTQSGK